MLTITTKFHGPTNRRGARIIATDCLGMRATVSYNHLDRNGDHIAAAKKIIAQRVKDYCARYPQDQKPFIAEAIWIMGDGPKGTMVHVMVNDATWAYNDTQGEQH